MIYRSEKTSPYMHLNFSVIIVQCARQDRLYHLYQSQNKLSTNIHYWTPNESTQLRWRKETFIGRMKWKVYWRYVQDTCVCVIWNYMMALLNIYSSYWQLLTSKYSVMWPGFAGNFLCCDKLQRGQIIFQSQTGLKICILPCSKDCFQLYSLWVWFWNRNI